MRRLALAGLALVMAAGVAASAFARDRAAAGPYACGTTKVYTYLLWPQGHPAIPAVNFQNFPVPHAELYKGPAGGTYPDSAFGGFLAAAGGQFAKTCTPVKLGRSAPLTSPKTLTTTSAITCAFPRAPDHVILKAGGGTQLLTIEPPKAGTTAKPQTAVSLIVKGDGATLKYDGKLCKQVEGPKPPPLMKFSFAAVAASFTSIAGTWSVSFSGTSCGGAARGPWTMTQTLSLNGAPVGQPGPRLVDLTSGSGGFTIVKNSDGSGQADAQFQVGAGPPATVTLGVTLSGNYSGLSIGTSQAQVTATPVTAC
jgi:hypothetical protein